MTLIRCRRLLVTLAAVTAGAGLAPIAFAQDTATKVEPKKPASPTTQAPTSPETLTVQGKKKVDAADKQVYDVTKDPAAATATAEETLNKVPGVSVDASGNVSVRGQTAKVYINGRPSLMMSGDNRQAALQSMPSAYISSIEVISNPGAQYASGGSEPIVNIVTKRNMPPGMFGNLTANLRSTGGGTANSFLSYTHGKLSLTTIAAYNDMTYRSTTQGRTEVLDTSGVKTRESLFDGISRSQSHGPFLMGNLQYDLGKDDILTAALNYNQNSSDSTFSNQTSQFDQAGALSDLSSSRSDSEFEREAGSLTLGYTHYGKKPDESLKLDLTLARNTSDSLTRSVSVFERSSVIGNTGTRINRQARNSALDNAILQAAYNTTFGDTQFTIGAQVTRDDSRADNLSFGPAATDADLVLQPLLSNGFTYTQTVNAIYSTAQRQIGKKWTVLAGLRAETLDLTTEETRTHTRSHIDYRRVNPSLFATYVVSSKAKLRLSYTHKQQRPEPSDLNPRTVYGSATSVTIGNTNLKPQETDSVELGYEVTQSPTENYALRAFYRLEDDTIVSSSRIIPDPQNLGNLVTETTRLNFGYQRSTGLTGNYSKRWNRKLSLNLDATATFIELESPHFSGVRSDTALSGGITGNYTFKNNAQLSGSYKLIGKRFTAQGYTSSYTMGYLSYRRNLTPKLSLVITAQDPLQKPQTVSVTSNNHIRSRSVSEREGSIFMIGLSRRFGGVSTPAKKTP